MNPTSALFGGDLGPMNSAPPYSRGGGAAQSGGGGGGGGGPGGLLPPGLGGTRFAHVPPGVFAQKQQQQQQQQQPSMISPQHQQQQQQQQQQVSFSTAPAVVHPSPTPSHHHHQYQQQQQQQQQYQYQQHQYQPSLTPASTSRHRNNSSTASGGGAGAGGHPHIPSDVLFASERPGMRPLPDSAYMISGNHHNLSDAHASQQRDHHHHGAVTHHVAAEAVAQQAAASMSPFAQRLAKRMNQTLQVERLPDSGQMNDNQFDMEQDLLASGLLGGFGPAAGGVMMDGGGSMTPHRREGSQTPRGGTPTPRRTGTRSTSRGRTVSTLGALERNRSGSAGSTRMQIGHFTVEYKEPTGDLQKRLALATRARKDEINRRTQTRLHRPTAAGSYADVNPCEPRVLEPGHPETSAHSPARLVVATRVSRSRTPLREMTRQDWDDAKRQQAFSMELRRHASDVMRRSMSSTASTYVNKHRGVSGTYLSEGAKWFTHPSPRLGIPCKSIVDVCKGERGMSPGPGSYNLPSQFLGR